MSVPQMPARASETGQVIGPSLFPMCSRPLPTIFLTGLLLFAIPTPSEAATGLDLPAAPPSDGIMAGPRESRAMLEWSSAAFTGASPLEAGTRVPLVVQRQDHNVLRFGRSCMETPIRIGKQRFEHGLGTHANSEIAVRLPSGAKAFQASIGIDNNDDTQGIRGTAQFSVDLDGAEVYRSELCRGGAEPVPVKVAIPAGARELVLKVTDAGDGPAYDQADWADARLSMADGTVRRLDENQNELLFLTEELPFSFLYGGTPSGQLLRTWSRTVQSKPMPDWTEHQIEWTDPHTGLRVTALVKVFTRFPAADWLLFFENTAAKDTPILENIQALDVLLATGLAKRPAFLHQLKGDSCSEESFAPFTTPLAAGQSLRLAPTAGRSSAVSAFPFFNLEYGGQGVITAVGWSGQWAASLDRRAEGPTRLRVGMELTRLLLHPGEKIRTPRVLVMHWEGKRQDAQNRFRRLMLFHYVPKQDDRPAALPFVLQCFDRYSGTRREWATEAGQKAAAQCAHELGLNTLWLDAAWFPGGFPNGVGNWSAKPVEFPRGLKPISEECHRLGMKFVVWFEPERVAPGSEIARDHPEFVFGGAKGGLFKLNEAPAREFLTDLLSRRIAEYGIDIYRNDFNIDPLPFWRQNDAPDRQGMTEIRYVEGHYALWDALLQRHPGLMIDNCASGGRRIDLETCMRSVPLWRSDTSCSPGHPEWNQVQTLGLAQYLPFHTACVWVPDPYDVRSAATAGLICQFDYLNPGFPQTLAQRSIAEAKANQPFFYGDFYPLAPGSIAPDQFIAYQFHRPDLKAGLVLAFRHQECPYLGVTVPLRGVDTADTYTLDFLDEADEKTVKTLPGRDLVAGLELRLHQPGTSLVVRYRQAGAPQP